MGNILVGNQGFQQHPEWDTDCFNNFVDELAADITGSCMIPMNLPRQEVQNIVKRAKKWFYKNYEYSVQENFLVIPAEMFLSDHFKYSRSFTLPGMDPLTGGGEIFSVFAVLERGNTWGGSMDINFTQGDFAIERMLMGGIYGGSKTGQAAENLQYYVINESFFDLARQIFKNPYGFHYSQLTHELKFMGETPKKDTILKVYQTIPECALFQDEAFFRYCSAKIKISLGQKLGIFGFSLPGNIQINPDIIKSLGEDELTAVIEEIKSEEGTDWMFHS